MTPYALYQSALRTGEFLPDKNQETAVLILEEVYQYLEFHYHQQQQKFSYFLKKIFYNFYHQSNNKNILPKNLYIWGDVGRGKTWLMDLFFKSLSFQQKKRLHFHQFMKTVHAQLKSHQGQREPLIHIAKAMAKNIKVLCLDEFLVNDIADALILAKLLQTFFDHNIFIILTSNTHPDNLYSNGLQRSQFLPAIDLIHQHMRILHLEANQDYRYQALESEELFFYPPDDARIKKLFLQFSHHAEKIISQQNIYLHNRAISIIACSDNILWIDFDVLCSSPRSQQDYLSLTEKFNIIILDNLHAIKEKDFNTAKYFIYLIDILYDAGIILILNSHIALLEIYPENNKTALHKEFERTLSRLNEMQSVPYLKKCREKHS